MTIFTAMFLHGGLLHLGGNMLFLWIFGDNVEDALGHARFLAFYLVCGVERDAPPGGSSSPASTIPNLGASGAIAGVLGAYFVLYPRARIVTIVPLFILFPARRDPRGPLPPRLVPHAVLDGILAARLRGPGRPAQGGVAFWAHVGGFRRGRRLGASLPAETRRRRRATGSREGPRLDRPRLEPLRARRDGFAMNLLSLHLPLDIAGRVPRGNEKFSLAFGISMAVVALAAPFLGHLADRQGKRRFLVPFVLAGVALTALVAAPGPVPRVLVFFALANVAFQCAYVFYNALLPDVSDASNSGRVSGFGVAAGYVGSLLGMVLVLPFVSGSIRAQMPGAIRAICDALSVAPVSSNVNDAWVRRNAYLPTALLWLAAAVPLLFFARLPKAEARMGRGRARPGRSSGSPYLLRNLPSSPLSERPSHHPITSADARTAVVSRVELPLHRRHPHDPDPDVDVLEVTPWGSRTARCRCCSSSRRPSPSSGGLLYGFLCQRVTIRTATLVALANWVLVFPLALLVRDPKAFTVVGVLAGIGLGGIKVTGRLGLIALVPKERMTEFFGFFTLAGEAASVLGPFLWAATLALFPDRSPAGYRAGVGVLFVVLVLAIGAFLRVRFPRERRRGDVRAAVLALVRALVGLFYRRIEVSGLENVPREGPILLVANHNNGLVDPMVVLKALPRPVVFVAKSTLWKIPVLRSLLDLLGCVPVVRRGEEEREISSKGEERNRGAFDRLAAELDRGGCVLIFPEGRSHSDPRLSELRTGAARVLLLSKKSPVVLPVGLWFTRRRTSVLTSS